VTSVRIPALGKGPGKPLAELLADIHAVDGAVCDFDDAALSAVNAPLRHVTVGVADAPWGYYGAPVATWIISGPTRFGRPYIAHLPMCCCGLMRETGVIYADARQRIVRERTYSRLTGGNCTCINPFGKPRYHRDTTCHEWHVARVLKLAKSVDRTYPKRRAR
jgi:hypothetical protein